VIAPVRSATVGDAMAKAKSFFIRVTEQEHDAWLAAAAADGITISEWIRRRCNGTQTIAASTPSAPKRKRR